MILVMSLLEKRKTRGIIKRVIKSLPIDLLKKNMAKIYKKFKEMYKGSYVTEALNHVTLIS